MSSYGENDFFNGWNYSPVKSASLDIASGTVYEKHPFMFDTSSPPPSNKSFFSTSPRLGILDSLPPLGSFMSMDDDDASLNLFAEEEEEILEEPEKVVVGCSRNSGSLNAGSLNGGVDMVQVPPGDELVAYLFTRKPMVYISYFTNPVYEKQWQTVVLMKGGAVLPCCFSVKNGTGVVVNVDSLWEMTRYFQAIVPSTLTKDDFKNALLCLGEPLKDGTSTLRGCPSLFAVCHSGKLLTVEVPSWLLQRVWACVPPFDLTLCHDIGPNAPTEFSHANIGYSFADDRPFPKCSRLLKAGLVLEQYDLCFHPETGWPLVIVPEGFQFPAGLERETKQAKEFMDDDPARVKHMQGRNNFGRLTPRLPSCLGDWKQCVVFDTKGILLSYPLIQLPYMKSEKTKKPPKTKLKTIEYK